MFSSIIIYQLRSPWACLGHKIKWLIQRVQARFRSRFTFALLNEKFLGEHRVMRNTTK